MKRERYTVDVISDYSLEIKVKAPKSKRLDDANSQSGEWTSRENFIFNTRYVVRDKLIFELKKKYIAYSEIEKEFFFSFLFKKDMKKSDTIKCTSDLLDFFPNDSDKEIFVDEVLQFQ